MKILSLATVYPNASDPRFGLFVQARLRALARLAEVKVAAPVGWLEYGRRDGRWIGRRGIPTRCFDAPLEVLHPRWLYPPFGGALNPLCLAASLLLPLLRLRRRFAFEVLDAHFAHLEGVAAALLSNVIGVPFVVTVRGNEPLVPQGWRARMQGWALRRAAAVIGVSQPLRDWAVNQGVAPARAFTVSNGVDAGVFHARDRLSARRTHAIDAGAQVIMTAGYLEERKGHHHIIDCLPHLAPGVVLLIAGADGRQPPYSAALRQRARERGVAERVRFTGSVDAKTMAELMAACDVFCLASSHEGCPNVVIEALACGAPVVASKVGAVPELIGSDAHGLVVPVGEVEPLRQALSEALRRTWDRPAIAAWGGRRSWSQVAAEVLAIMELATGGAATPRRCEAPAARPPSW